MGETVKRKYESPLRAAAAAETRSRIREAAGELFVQCGYVTTTMRDVARRAGVAERTLYDAFSTKSALFSHTLDVAVVGDEAPVPVKERPEVIAAREHRDPQDAVTQMVDYGTALLERAGALIMVSVEAAGADLNMRAAADAGARATHAVHLEFTRALEKRGFLRSGLDATTAADIVFALASPHTHALLRKHCGWSRRQYRDWLEALLAREVLGLR